MAAAGSRAQFWPQAPILGRGRRAAAMIEPPQGELELARAGSLAGRERVGGRELGRGGKMEGPR